MQEDWDVFGDMTERLFSRFPALAAVGSHDIEDLSDDDPASLESFDLRWRMPVLEPGRYWHSVTRGAVHFFTLSCNAGYHALAPGS